jgi:hypothetical protein
MAASRFSTLTTLAVTGLTVALALAPSALTQAQTSPPSEPTSAPPPAGNAPRFSCQWHNGQPTVMYAPESQPGQSYPWAVPQDMGSAWPAQRRCTEISARLERYRPDGLLTLQTTVENGYNTVCVTTEAISGCRIVFTVPPDQDPVVTRDRVSDNLAVADRGEATQGVTTFTGGGTNVLGQIGTILGLPSANRPGSQRSGINLKPFLDPADGGTGARLNGSNNPGRPLNPDTFR